MLLAGIVLVLIGYLLCKNQADRYVVSGFGGALIGTAIGKLNKLWKLSNENKYSDKKVKSIKVITALGKDLIFISLINRDGSGTVDLSKKDMSNLDNTEFTITHLSGTLHTFIASEFNSYVVKFKKP